MGPFNMSVFLAVALTGCAQGLTPQARNINIPSPQAATEREAGINERPDSVIYLPLGHDVLVPEAENSEKLPDVQVGPYELRGETLAGALQLITAGRQIPIAFQSDLGLTRTVTVANLSGKLPDVVGQVCALADLYCIFEAGSLTVKERQTFTVTVPPIGADADRATLLTNVAGAVKAITGREPVVDQSSRTIIYEATSRTAVQAARYFQRLRSNTALVVYETYIWEVALDTGSSMGINWDQIGSLGKFQTGISLSGAVATGLGTPISIGLPTRGEVNLSSGDVIKFISQYGAVKTISQPQLTMLSGSKARLRVADRQNYVSQITRTVVNQETTVSTETDSVDTGFTLEIASNWDNSTVYGNVNILLQEVRSIDTFDDNPDAIVQLPQTTEREVQTQVRVRPGDSLLIAGLVRERDSMDKNGLGIEKPILPTNRTSKAGNVELVFLLKPRVIVFTDTADRFVRQPVDADTPAPDVELPKGMSQTVPLKKQITAARPPVRDARVFDAVDPVPDHPTAPVAIPAERGQVDPPVDQAPLPPLAPAPAKQTGSTAAIQPVVIRAAPVEKPPLVQAQTVPDSGPDLLANANAAQKAEAAEKAALKRGGVVAVDAAAMAPASGTADLTVPSDPGRVKPVFESIGSAAPPPDVPADVRQTTTGGAL